MKSWSCFQVLHIIEIMGYRLFCLNWNLLCCKWLIEQSHGSCRYAISCGLNQIFIRSYMKCLSYKRRLCTVVLIVICGLLLSCFHLFLRHASVRVFPACTTCRALNECCPTRHVVCTLSVVKVAFIENNVSTCKVICAQSVWEWRAMKGIERKGGISWVRVISTLWLLRISWSLFEVIIT
jgi:hypothetical protein